MRVAIKRVGKVLLVLLIFAVPAIGGLSGGGGTGIGSSRGEMIAYVVIVGVLGAGVTVAALIGDSWGAGVLGVLQLLVTALMRYALDDFLDDIGYQEDGHS